MIEFYITCVGITILITQSSILERFRNAVSSLGDLFDELIHCAMCTGFWVGLILSLIFEKDVLHYSVASSLISWIVFITANGIFSITIYYQSITDNEEDNEI